MEKSIVESSRSIEETREEGLIRDVIDELDRERQRRAELELELSRLKENQKLLLTTMESEKIVEEKKKANHLNHLSNSSAISKKAFLSMRAERDGFKELIDALTADNDAVMVAVNQPKTTLPLHLVRMLEILPYDPRSQKSALEEEEIYEWQIYKGGKWIGLLRNFPPRFRKLPIVLPGQASDMEDATVKSMIPDLLPKHSVLTDDIVSKVISVEKGYGLPKDGGTWEWVSGWRVENRRAIDSQKSDKRIACDGDGWIYGEEVDHFINSPNTLCWDHANITKDTVQRPFRRRRWTRQRALRSYPRASANTIHYLRLLAENAKLSVTVTKLTDQLVDTKHKLTEAEANLQTNTELLSREIESLNLQLQAKVDSNHESGEKSSTKPRVSDLRLDQQFGKVRTAAGGFASSIVLTASSAASQAFFKSQSVDDDVEEKRALNNSQHDSKTKEILSPSSILSSSPSALSSYAWRRIGLSVSAKNKSVHGPSIDKADETNTEVQSDNTGDRANPIDTQKP